MDRKYITVVNLNKENKTHIWIHTHIDFDIYILLL
jgi:hypothetical protein